MTPWENTQMKTLLFFSLLGSERYAGKRVKLPKHEDEITMPELVDFYLHHGQKHFEKKYKDYEVIESEWFLDFVKYDHTIQKIERFLKDKTKAPKSRNQFLDGLIESLRLYSVWDTRQVILSEEKRIRRYFSMLTDVAKMILRCAMSVKAETEAQRADGQELVYLETMLDKECRTELLKELLSATEQMEQKDWTRTDLWAFPEERLAERPELRYLLQDYLYAPGDDALREWLDLLAEDESETEAAYAVTRRVRSAGRDEKKFRAAAKDYMIVYYESKIDAVDFRIRPLADRQDGPNRQGLQVDMLLYFARYFDLEIPQIQAKNLFFVCPYPPEDGEVWLPGKSLEEAEIRQEIINNIHRGIANDLILGWHIRYCMEHGITECRDRLKKIALSHPRRMWLRELAMNYTCANMTPEVIKRELLPTLQGEMFFLAAEWCKSPGDVQMAALVWDYGMRYTANKMRCDVLLIYLQNRKGLDSFMWHMEKRHQLPPESRVYGAVEAIRLLDHPELLDEMKHIFRMTLRDSFKDDPEFSVRAAIADALVRMLNEKPEVRSEVLAFFEDCQQMYGDISWKREYIAKCFIRSGVAGF